MTIFPQRMKRLTAVVLQADADELTRRLLNAGIMDFIDIQRTDRELGLQPGPEAPAGTGSRASGTPEPAEVADMEDLRRRIEMFLQNARLPLPQSSNLDAGLLQRVNLQEAGRELDKLAAGIQQIRENQQSAQQDIHRLQELHRQISQFAEITEIAPPGSYLEIQAGTVGRSRYNSLVTGLKTYPAYIHRGGSDSGTETGKTDEYQVLLIFLNRDAERIGQLLDRVGWKTIDIPPEFRGMRTKALEELDGKIKEAEKRQKELALSAGKLVEERRGWLEETWKNLRMNELFSTMQSNYGKTRETVVFSGWIPSHRSRETTEIIEKASGGRCFLEWTTPEQDTSINKEQVPVLLEHSRSLLPFQWLVENYSIPRYGSVDPTVLVTATYLLMFGLMFGDAGHGAVLMLAGIIIHLIRKRSARNSGKSPAVDTAAKLGELITWCGGAAVIMGVLFGSYFGNPWLPPLWFDYHGIVSGHGGGSGAAPFITSIYDILGVTIKFGIGIIGIGILLNCISRFRAGDWFHLIFDHGGLLAGWFYAGGVYAGFRFVQSGYAVLPPAGILLGTIGVPLLIFAAKAPAEFIIKQRESARNSGSAPLSFRLSLIPNFLMDWILELLELFTSYLSNTLSFMRIAGLGIAHVSLMIAFFQIAGSIASPLGSAAVLILGNAVVIILEGLSAGIQALRLHYYEFFSKYFCGSGRVYHPISLRRNT